MYHATCTMQHAHAHAAPRKSATCSVRGITANSNELAQHTRTCEHRHSHSQANSFTTYVRNFAPIEAGGWVLENGVATCSIVLVVMLLVVATAANSSSGGDAGIIN